MLEKLDKTAKWVKKFWRKLLPLALAVLTIWVVSLPAIARGSAQIPLPKANIHPLPPSLVKLAVSLGQDPENLGDYFDQVQPSPLGHLIWSNFPVTIYLDYPTKLPAGSGEQKRYYTWQQAIKTAIADWQAFFPLEIVDNSITADINIFYREPPIARRIDPETGLISFGRARTAQASYKFYWTGENFPRLRHRMNIDIKPGLAALSLQATARHELGHALGIWGHSDRPEDALYPAQTPESPPISPRDLRTLYRIYQQPTQLGWPSPVPN